MAKLYPRKQTVIIFVVCLMAVVATLWYSGTFNFSKSFSDGVITYTPKSTEIISASNSWQNQFFGSTTGSIKLAEGKTAKSSAPAETPLSLTDQLGRSYFSEYMMAKQAGLENDPDVINSINSRFIEKVSNIANPTIYFSKDIKIIPDSGGEQMTDYARNLLRIFKSYPADDAATIANKALNDEDMETLQEIDPIITDFETIVKSLRAVSVPKSATQYHLDILNGISVSLYNAQALRNVEKDPTQGLAAIGIYTTGMQNLINALNNIQKFFISNGIAFSS